jgi:hypothetical protein
LKIFSFDKSAYLTILKLFPPHKTAFIPKFRNSYTGIRVMRVMKKMKMMTKMMGIASFIIHGMERSKKRSKSGIFRHLQASI